MSLKHEEAVRLFQYGEFAAVIASSGEINVNVVRWSRRLERSSPTRWRSRASCKLHESLLNWIATVVV
jgi:hypothetical protein